MQNLKVCMETIVNISLASGITEAVISSPGQSIDQSINSNLSFYHATTLPNVLTFKLFLTSSSFCAFFLVDHLISG